MLLRDWFHTAVSRRESLVCVASHCFHCDGNRIIFLRVVCGEKFARQHGINEKSGRQLKNNYCLHQSYSTTHAREPLNFNMTSFSKGKGEVFMSVSTEWVCLTELAHGQSEYLGSYRSRKSRREISAWHTINLFIYI